VAKYAILRENQILKQVVMVGDRSNYQNPVIIDLVFDTKKKAEEVSKVLTGKTEVVTYKKQMKK